MTMFGQLTRGDCLAASGLGLGSLALSLLRHDKTQQPGADKFPQTVVIAPTPPARP